MIKAVRGGQWGHALRRLIHVAMIVIPWLYYWQGDAIAAWFSINKTMLLVIILGVVLVFDIIRANRQWLMPGQRHYEAKRLSAIAWTALGLTIVLIATPEAGLQGSALTFPLIAGLAIVDPLLGELRQRDFHPYILAGCGFAVLLVIWIFAVVILGTPFWCLVLLPPIILLAELYKFPGIDDNFLMLVIPWLVIMSVYYFI